MCDNCCGTACSVTMSFQYHSNRSFPMASLPLCVYLFWDLYWALCTHQGLACHSCFPSLLLSSPLLFRVSPLHIVFASFAAQTTTVMHNSYTRAMMRYYSPNTPVLTLLLLLLLLCCTTGGLAGTARRCMFDQFVKRMEEMRNTEGRAEGVVREIPRKGQGPVQAYTASAILTEEEKNKRNWTPIRIKAFTRDLDDPSRYCTKTGQVILDRTNERKVCGKSNILTVRKKKLIVERIIPGAIKLHTDRLSVVREQDTVLVPKHATGTCNTYHIPEEHFTEGLVDADLYVYVSAAPGSGEVAWAIFCRKLEDGRPFIGATNLDPHFVKDREDILRTMAHEIGHILGFTSDTFRLHGIASAFENVRQKKKVWMISTPKAKEIAQKYYNCSRASGLELESERYGNYMESHWEQRNALDDMMAPAGTRMYYSALSLALFDSLPFYKANFSMAEPTTWGNNTGCNFLEKKCLENGTTDYPEMFCRQYPVRNEYTCTFDRLALGKCMLKAYKWKLAPEFQYFGENPYGGAITYMDYCPVVQADLRRGCTNGNAKMMPGSFIGPNSRCVKGDGVKYEWTHLGDVCVNTQCNKEDGTVSVQFYQDTDWYPCKAGETVIPKGPKWSGSIICPKYEEVCTEHHNVTIVLEPLPEQDNDNQPAPANITWSTVEPPSPSSSLQPPIEETMEIIRNEPVKGEEPASHLNEHIVSSQPTHTPTLVPTVVEQDRVVSEASTVHSGSTREQGSTHNEGEKINQYGSDSDGFTTLIGSNEKNAGESTDAKSNRVANGIVTPSVTVHGSVMNLNIGLHDGSVTATRFAPLVLFSLVVAVTMSL